MDNINGLDFLIFFLGGIAIGYAICWRRQQSLKNRGVPSTRAISDLMPLPEFRYRIQSARSWGDIHALVGGWRNRSVRYPSWDTVVELYGEHPINVRAIEQYALVQVAKRYHKLQELERMIPGINETVRKIVKGEKIH